MNEETPIFSQLRVSMAEAMERASMKARPLAEKAGLGQTAVRDILSGRTKDIKLSTVQNIADALGIDFYNLLLPQGPIDPKRLTSIVGVVKRGFWDDGSYSPPSKWKTFVGRDDVTIEEITGERYAFEVVDDSADTKFPRGSILDVIFMEEVIYSSDGDVLTLNPDPAPLLKGRPFVISERFKDGPKREITAWKQEVDDNGALWLVSLSSKPEHQNSIKVSDAREWEIGKYRWVLPHDMRLGAIIGAYIPQDV